MRPISQWSVWIFCPESAWRLDATVLGRQAARVRRDQLIATGERHDWLLIQDARLPAPTAWPGRWPGFSDVRVFERFLSFIEVTPSGCWQWIGTIIEGGYGDIKIGEQHHLAHRLAYELFIGPIPDGLEIDHLCHTIALSCAGGITCLHRRCVNPTHGEPVTSQVNVLRGNTVVAANATKTHCPNGHPYSGANLRVRPGGRRGCRECERAATRQWRARQGAVA